MTDFVLVSCSKSKLEGVHRARDLYEPSPIFRKRRAWARQNGDHMGILSAKHGYLPPWQAIEDYEKRIDDRTDVWKAFVLRGLLPDLDYYDVKTVWMLAGRKYIEPLVPELEAHGYDVVDYNSGKLPGERMSKLDNDLAPGEQTTLADGGHSHEDKSSKDGDPA